MQKIDEIDELVKISSMVLQLTENIDSLLQLITDKARELLCCEMSYITELDEKRRELVLTTSSGSISEWFKKTVRLPLNAGIAGWVFRENTLAVCVDYASDQRRSQSYVRVVENEGVKSFIALPLTVNSNPIGVLFICKRSTYQFDAKEIKLASAFANLASIAMQNSNFYTEQKRMSNRLKGLNARLTRRNWEIKQTNIMHNQFIITELEGEGPKDIADTLSQLAHNPVLVEDRYGVLFSIGMPKESLVNSHFEGIDQLRVLYLANTSPNVQHGLELLAGKKRSIFIKTTHIGRKNRLLVTPIVAHGEILGYITIPEIGHKLSSLDVIASEYAAMVLALDIVKKRSIFEAEQRSKGDFLNQLLYGDFVSDEEVLKRASYSGYYLVGPRRVMVMSFDRPTSSEEVESFASQITRTDLDRILGRVNEAISIISPGSFAVNMKENIIMIAVSKGGEDKFSHDSIEGRIAEAARGVPKEFSQRLTASIGIGCPCYNPKDYRRSFQQALRAVEIGNWLGRKDEIISLEGLGIYGLLFEPESHQRLSAFSRETLNPLLIYDNKYGSELLKTLSTYFNCKRNIKLCSQVLFVHENTIRQRLERATKELQKLDLDNGDDELTLQIALKVWEAEERPKYVSGHPKAAR